MQMHFLEMKKEIVITFHRLYTKYEFHNKSFDILDSSYLEKKKKEKKMNMFVKDIDSWK